MRTYPDLAIQIPQILLPQPSIDLERWAVIACDQFTSQPEYWQKVEKLVGNAPSTFHLTLPEVYLGTAQEAARIESTRRNMSAYLQSGQLVQHEGLVLVERSVAGKTRHGLMLALDLERYDFNKGSQSLIRATEGTILDRLPPRMKIRQGAQLELPHILVLIDDPQCSVIEPLLGASGLTPLYDFELMLGSGHLRGWQISDSQLEQQVVSALRRLADPAAFQARYQTNAEQGVLLFAMGDGNHSLATAKAIWEQMKAQVGPDHPARYALVEIENVHDQGLDFEPIHRVAFDVHQNVNDALSMFFSDGVQMEAANEADMIAAVNSAGTLQKVGLISPQGCQILTFLKPTSNLPVGTLQPFLDAWKNQGGYDHIDYVHGDQVVTQLGAQPGNLGFYLPGMPKSDLFKTVILDGVLPRKTFSMGEAIEKRFYMEARKITP